MVIVYFAEFGNHTRQSLEIRNHIFNHAETSVLISYALQIFLLMQHPSKNEWSEEMMIAHKNLQFIPDCETTHYRAVNFSLPPTNT